MVVKFNRKRLLKWLAEKVEAQVADLRHVELDGEYLGIPYDAVSFTNDEGTLVYASAKLHEDEVFAVVVPENIPQKHLTDAHTLAAIIKAAWYGDKCPDSSITTAKS